MFWVPPRSTHTDTLVPYTTLFPSVQHDGLVLPRPLTGSRRAAFGRTGARSLRRPPDPARHAGLACRRARMAAAGPLLRRAAARHRRPRRLAAATAAAGRATARSEEHTSELQSLMRISYAVFCLKKKNH